MKLLACTEVVTIYSLRLDMEKAMFLEGYNDELESKSFARLPGQ